MKDSRRHDLLLAGAALIVVGTLAVYVVLVVSWLRGKPSAPAAPISSNSPPPAQELAVARAEFRQNLVDPRAALNLSEALARAGRPVDSFYVLFWARHFFPEGEFRAAHGAVVLKRSDYLNGAPYDRSAENEAKLKRRLAEDPSNPRVVEYLAHLAVDRGDVAGAQTLLDGGLASRPDDPGLLSFKAALTGSSNPLEAVPLWARVANGAPRSFEARRALEELQRVASRKEEGADGESARFAREALEELLKANPDEPGPFIALGLALWQRGDAGPTRALVAQAMAKKTVNPGAYALDGALALSDGELDKAIRRLTAAWERDPDDLFAAAKLAQIYQKQSGDAEAALPYYIALYRRDPDYADGEPAEDIIRRVLDARRKSLLSRATPDSIGRWLEHEDGSLRAEACARAAELKDPRWIDALAERLDDDDEIVRHNADYALYQLAQVQPDAIRVRRDAWLADTRPLVRARALNLFADLYPGETYPLALRALYDPNPGVRYFVKTLVLDRYYAGIPAATKAKAEYLAQEKNPAVLALYKVAPAPEPAQ